MRKIIILLICCAASSPLWSQETAFSDDAFDAYKRGKAHFEDKLYGPAKTEMAVFLDYVNGTTSEKHRQYLLEAEQIYKTSAFHLNLPEAESELVEFVEFHSPDPIIIDPVQALGSYYYNEKQYDKSIYFYDKIDLELLKGEDFSEASFKRGYSHFVKKEFQNAKFYFSRTKDFRNKYYYPSNYYNGMCQYFEGDYNAAVASYERVSLSSAYSPYIPYYITQIYFAQDQLEKLITYGDQVSSIKTNRSPKKKRNKTTLRTSILQKKTLYKSLASFRIL